MESTGQLDEAGSKKLKRIQNAAYWRGQRARGVFLTNPDDPAQAAEAKSKHGPKHARLVSVAAELNRKVAAKKAAKKSMSEEVDPIDLILAEGIELYGEEGMTKILADFAETGEISEELAGLIDGVE
jgi:hypothetical protein